MSGGKAFIAWMFLLLLVGGSFFGLWTYYEANRTAVVRQVLFDSDLGPEVYMNDGTVWSLNDTLHKVHMIQGDKVRYIFVANPSQTMDSDSPDACELKDLTTGYDTEAVRVSAPFKHPSCPSE